MTESAPDLDWLAKSIREAPPAAELLTAVGGEDTFSGTRASNVVAAFKNNLAGLDFAVWEFFSELRPPGLFVEIPRDLEYLDRARLFGPGGDVELRRDQDRLLWRFVGPPNTKVPSGLEHDEWASNHPLVCLERTSLLWGYRSDSGGWFEPRVGHANLRYGADPSWRAVALRFREYSWAGSVHHVWWRGLVQATADLIEGAANV